MNRLLLSKAFIHSAQPTGDRRPHRLRLFQRGHVASSLHDYKFCVGQEIRHFLAQGQGCHLIFAPTKNNRGNPQFRQQLTVVGTTHRSLLLFCKSLAAHRACHGCQQTENVPIVQVRAVHHPCGESGSDLIERG